MGQRDINSKMSGFDERARLERPLPPQMVQKTKAVRHKGNIKIFEVQSAAGGDGLYNCYEQKLDEDKWADFTGVDKFLDKVTVNVVVLNLAEFNPESAYVEHLAAGDMLIAWQFNDDERNTRWVGLPLRESNADRPRIAYCGSDAGNTTSMGCYLDVDGSGTPISVSCFIEGAGTRLDSAYPLLRDGDPILVTKVGSTWRCTTTFSQPTRKAYMKNDAPSGSHATCYLDTDATGDEIEVYFSLAQGETDLRDCNPFLLDGDMIFVTRIGGTWYCQQVFNPSLECACS